MDINNLLKNVNNVDEYISVTQELTDSYKNTKVHINITTVLALKKIRSLEIEYLNKCYENGAACVLLERLLSLPPSKTWGVLGKELVSLLQYWLEAIRKYLINHSVHWWSFLKLILKFIKEIRLKDPTIPNMLAELTTECLFDIASRDKVDAQQQQEILHYLNMFCAESSREIRFALRNKFGGFFAKLGAQLVTSGYLPSQYSTLEALVRWLVPRQDLALRSAAAERWFPQDLCPEAAREIFLRTKWMDFYQDARDFLNALNEYNGLVTSVVCRRLTVGNILIISGAEKHETWLDINSSGNSVTVLLDPKMLETFGVSDHRTFETLVIADDNTQSANLHNESQELTLSLSTFSPPRVLPSDIAVGAAQAVTVVVSARAHLPRLDAALRGVFGDKYHLLMDLNTRLSLSPPRSQEPKNNRNCSEEDTRFSHPVEVKRRKHYGYMATSANPGGLVSPSTASTSSLAQLQDRLAALPRFKCDKKVVSVCAEPQLSNVTELTEADDRSFQSTSTVKLRSCGVGVCCYTGPFNKSSRKKAESDSEVLNLKTPLVRCISPVTHGKNSNSCLQAASDDSAVIDTVERLSKNKGLNIVDLLAREALQAKPIEEEKIGDSAVNSNEAKSQEPEENSEAIEDTPVQDADKQPVKSKAKRKRICTVVSKSTTDDESNTEAINETPVIVNPKKSKLSRRKSIATVIEPKVTDKHSFDVHAIDEFFSQHVSETKAGDVVISPTLARKINESSSESSKSFDENFKLVNEDLNTEVPQFEFNETEIIECLNGMVDKVCIDLEKCSEYLRKDDEVVVCKNKAEPKGNKKALKETNLPIKQTDLPSKPKRNIKLTYKTMKEKKPRVVVTKKRKNNEVKSMKKMSTIMEQKDGEEVLEINSPKQIINADIAKMDSPIIIQTKSEFTLKKTDEETPVMNRKRKLYSPKDDEIDKEKNVAKRKSEIDEDDITLSELKTYKRIITSPKTTAVCYKEIEKERKKYIHSRSKKGRGKIKESPSPRTLKKNAEFDKLKTNIENNEKITIANKKTTGSDIYKFTSESEDEDFMKKKIEVRNRISATNTVCSVDSAKCTRRGRKKTQVNYSVNSSNDDAKQTKPARKTKAFKKSNNESKTDLKIDPVISLVDERMREGGSEELNTSIVIEKPKTTTPAQVELVLHEPPQMEPITDDQETTKSPIKGQLNKRTKKTQKLSTRKEKQSKNDELKVVLDKEDDRTVSPLPGLVVESMADLNDPNESVAAITVQNLQKKRKDGLDLINESSNTQNLILSDIERCNYSPQNVSVNITDENMFVDYNEENTAERKSKTIKPKKTEQNIKSSQNKKIIKTERNVRGKNVTGGIIEITDIPYIADAKSEKSIATDGITAHGDYDEAPPSPEMIRKSMQPREIQDLNESMKNYFVELNREIYKSPPKVGGDRSTSTKQTGVNKADRPALESSPSVKSPVVSVQRLSFEDISKWMPSRRSSETDSSTNSNPKVPDIFDIPIKTRSNTDKSQKEISESTSISRATQNHKSELKKSQQDKPIASSPKVRSPLVPIVAISLEDYDKWLPMPKKQTHEDTHKMSVSLRKQNSPKLVYNTRQKSKFLKVKKTHDAETMELNTYKRVNPWKKVAVAGKTKSNTEVTTANTTEHDFSVTCSEAKAAKNTKNAKRTNTKTMANASDNDSDSHFKQSKGKSSYERISTVISPVKSFKNLISNLHNSDAPAEDRSEIIRDIFTKQRFASTITNKESSIDTVGKSIQDARVDSGSKINKIAPNQDVKRPITRSQDSKLTEVKVIERGLSVSTRRDETFKRPMKRKSSPLRSDAKKMNFEANDSVTITSGPSTGSVNDWFRRMEPSKSCANDTTLPFSDIVHNIMEKLDTTLPESNQNTSRKFVNLFVEAQKQLVELKEERRKMYKSVATDIITKMVAVMDEKFTELDKRSQEMDTEFREQLKKQAFDLIREDCDQKRLMVHLLKEDVQAVLNHIELSSTESE